MKIVLNRRASRSFHANTGVPQGSIRESTLLLIFIKDLLEAISSQLGILCPNPIFAASSTDPTV